MSEDLMDKVFGDIKGKSEKPVREGSLSPKALSEEDLRAEALRDAVQSNKKMIGVWNNEIAAAMQFLANTTPRFSISTAAAGWIMAGIERDYPGLLEEIREAME